MMNKTNITNKIHIVIVAAGIGNRMKSDTPKQYLKLFNGKTILETTLEVFLNFNKTLKIILVLNKNDNIFSTLKIASNSKISTVIGGKNRYDSVLAGLNSIETSINSYVMVHDVARCGITINMLDNLYNTVIKADNIGGILALPIIDTLKKKSPKKIETLNRELMYLAQTPQMFLIKPLIKSINEAKSLNIIITDEASAIENSGYNYTLVNSDKRNFKITHPEDLLLMDYYLYKNNLLN